MTRRPRHCPPHIPILLLLPLQGCKSLMQHLLKHPPHVSSAQLWITRSRSVTRCARRSEISGDPHQISSRMMRAFNRCRHIFHDFARDRWQISRWRGYQGYTSRSVWQNLKLEFGRICEVFPGNWDRSVSYSDATAPSWWSMMTSAATWMSVYPPHRPFL